jgi:hypothetical protein
MGDVVSMKSLVIWPLLALVAAVAWAWEPQQMSNPGQNVLPPQTVTQPSGINVTPPVVKPNWLPSNVLRGPQAHGVEAPKFPAQAYGRTVPAAPPAAVIVPSLPKGPGTFGVNILPPPQGAPPTMGPANVKPPGAP